ncbi:MAG: response regulator transcription factor [Betaproteobacteria bacterium]
MNTPAPRTLLLADDDPTFCRVLARALERRGFSVRVAHDTDSALGLARAEVPAHAVVDLRMPGTSGLALVDQLRRLSADMRIVVLTGYASIATAVEAMKLGATHYLAKPADADEIVAAFGEAPPADGRVPEAKPLSVDRMAWEHIQRVLAEHGGNVSATARALGMHRRTLQRKLGKRAPRA